MTELSSILKKFHGRRIVVIGDVMLDRFLKGEVSRINPEAPVPIVCVNSEFSTLGGAANVAANISSLGGSVSLFGFVGNDSEAKILKNLLTEKNITHVFDESTKTTVKTRVLADNQHLLRFDKEEMEEKKFTDQTKRLLLSKAKEAEVILISDYAKGTITEDLMNLLNSYKEKMVVDPKPKNKNLYHRVLIISPNEKEAKEMSQCSDILKAGEIIREELNTNVLVTRGKDGMSLFSDNRVDIPTYAREVYDVSGAGDSAIASFSLAFSAGASLEEAAIIANYVAGIAVEKVGTYAVSLSDLTSRISSTNKKILDLKNLKEAVSKERKLGRKIVWTNGCFDLLHVGHIRYLKEAKKLGDILIVGINSDTSVRLLKGSLRPIQPESDRAEIISSLEFIDYTFIFSELTTEKYLSEFKPDIFVKGGDYSLDSINQVEKLAVEQFGGKIVFVPIIDGKSSSNIIRKATLTEPNVSEIRTTSVGA